MKIYSFDKKSSPEESLSFCKELALYLLAKAKREGVMCPSLEELKNLLEKNDILALCTREPDYTDTSVYQAEIFRQVVALFSKSTFIDLGVDKQAAALKAFMDAEEACRITNDLFEKWHDGLVSFPSHLCAVYHRAQVKIARVLGEAPKLSELKFRFGKGANRSVTKQRASIVEKLQARITCSEELYEHHGKVLEELSLFAEFHKDLREEVPRVRVELSTGRVAFVPKSWKTERAVDVPPSLNGLVQLGIADDITRRMSAVGLKIDDQSVNQTFARIGSITGEYATLDLTSASDMNSRSLIRSLFPFDWCQLLFPACVQVTEVMGKLLCQQKFASMGNGFTFPIETLVFWALASSVRDDGWASVYGDDIVIKSEDYEAVVEVLKHAGFLPNKAKSFNAGPFRESCGKDFLKGTQIRPVYQKELLSGAELFRLHNFFVRKRWFDVAERIELEIPKHIRLYGPDGYGDGHLLGRWKPYKKKDHVARGYAGALFDTYVLRGKRDNRKHRPGDRILPAYSIYVRNDGDCVMPESAPSSEDFFRRGGRFWKYLLKLKLAADPIPQQSGVKTPSFPGVSGYKRICIYTFAVNSDS